MNWGGMLWLAPAAGEGWNGETGHDCSSTLTTTSCIRPGGVELHLSHLKANLIVIRNEIWKFTQRYIFNGFNGLKKNNCNTFLSPTIHVVCVCPTIGWLYGWDDLSAQHGSHRGLRQGDQAWHRLVTWTPFCQQLFVLMKGRLSFIYHFEEEVHIFELLDINCKE